MSKARQWTDDYDQRDTSPDGYEEVERLRAENKKLRDVADAVRKYVDLYEIEKTNSGQYVIKTLEALDD